MCPFHANPTAPGQPAAQAAPGAALPEAIVHEERAQLDFSRSMSYGDYLQLDAVLTAQKPCRPRTTSCSSSSSTRPANSG